MKTKPRFYIPYLVVAMVLTVCLAQAQKKGSKTDDGDDGGEVVTTLIPHSSDGIFEKEATYAFEVKNTFKREQTGTLSYLVTSETGKPISTKSQKVRIGASSTSTFELVVPQMGPGFYKVNFMINVTDYDDTTRRAFGVQPLKIQSPYRRPADFDQFWKETKRQLAAVKPEFKMIERPDSEKENRKVYMIQMKSLNNVTVRGWLTIPKTKLKNKKFPVLVFFPGMLVDLLPLGGADEDVAILTLNIRGRGDSRDEVNPLKSEYIFYNIEDKNRYILRGAIMDCVRSIDFICSRPELRHDNIIVNGGSLGGYLAIATAALDNRVALCSAKNPIMSDIRNLLQEVEWPITDIRRYLSVKPGLTYDKIVENLDYFDTKNFALNIKCPTVVGCGLLDHLVPPNNVYAMYNNLPGKKKMIVFRDLGHEVGVSYEIYQSKWMHDEFALF